MRPTLLIALCGIALGLGSCGGDPSFECGTLEVVLTRVESGQELRYPMGGWHEARTGYDLVRVRLEPPQGERNPAKCDLALGDAQGNRFEPVTSWWQLTGPGVLVWEFEVPDTASGLHLLLPDGTRVDLDL
ncbi:MAG TPA: hypothetical protein DCY40_04585 [Actinobacteria bacterium]|nr:hypothetical protein [Actinomycetota bacterium]